MEFDYFMVSYFWTLAIVLLSQAVVQLIFKKKKDFIHLIYSLVFIIMLTYFAISQTDFFYDNFTRSGLYALIAILLAVYVIFFVRIYSFVNNLKLKKDKTVS